jgi:hypothetical protein
MKMLTVDEVSDFCLKQEPVNVGDSSVWPVPRQYNTAHLWLLVALLTTRVPVIFRNRT